MQRVLVLGCGGAGKSTLARRLGRITGLPVIHLDAEYWRAGWVETPREQWIEKVTELAARDRWIMDGNFSATLDARLATADSIIFLDVPRWRCLLRVFKRLAIHAGRTRSDMAAGCREKIDWEFLQWIWNFPTCTRPEVLNAIERHAGGKSIHVLRTPSEVARFLTDCQREIEPAAMAAALWRIF